MIHQLGWGESMDIQQLVNPFGWDWGSIWHAAVGAGLGTAAVQGAITLYRERTQKQDKAAYLALRVAVLLEAYGSDCCRFYFDNASAIEPPDEQYPAWRTDLPDPPELPDDTEAWRAMNRELLARCLNFPNKVRASQNAIEACAEYTEHELGNTLDEHASARGVEAWDIACALRKAYGLQSAEIVYDYHDTLRKVHRASVEQREESAAKQAELLSELSDREREFPD